MPATSFKGISYDKDQEEKGKIPQFPVNRNYSGPVVFHSGVKEIPQNDDVLSLEGSESIQSVSNYDEEKSSSLNKGLRNTMPLMDDYSVIIKQGKVQSVTQQLNDIRIDPISLASKSNH